MAQASLRTPNSDESDRSPDNPKPLPRRGLGAPLGASAPRTMRLRTLLLLLLPLLALPAAADTILLKDGRRFEGTVKSETETEVVFTTEFGDMTFKASEVSKIEKGRTPRQEFDARYKAAKTAADFFEVGTWAAEQKLRSQARRAMRRTKELEPNHAGANTWLGFVKYKGQWVTEEDLAKLKLREDDAEMLKRGLVKHGERWVTVTEKEKLDAGLVYHEGKWMTLADQKAAQGYTSVDGQWILAHVALAQEHGAAVLAQAGVKGEVVLGPDHAVVGPFKREFLEGISAGLVTGRKLFDESFDAPEGVALLGGRAAEMYVWGRDNDQYIDTVDYLASLTNTVPPEWADVVKQTHGLMYWDPFCCSSARVKGRPEDHLAGHSYHHWGHLLLNRHRYDGRLLPPWFDEGYAVHFEFQVHERIDVMCLGQPASIVTKTATGRTQSSKQTVEYVFDTKLFREGHWRAHLLAALEGGAAQMPSFDDLSKRQFGELTVLDIAMGMVICSWLSSHAGGLEKFHASLRASSPKPPQRILYENPGRHARYDAAFQAAVGMNWKQADEAWRKWFLEGAEEVKEEDGGSRRRRRRDR